MKKTLIILAASLMASATADAQEQELWYIPFYLIYIFWHIKLLFKTRNNTEAYRQNPFELEAYANDHNLNYLQTRKRFAFRRYI